MDRHAKSALRKELQRAEEQRDRLDAVILYLRERLAAADNEVEPSTTAAPRVAQRPTSGPPRSGKRLTAADAAEQVLAGKGEPMRTPDLLRAVQALGARMKDTDGLYKTLDRNERFRREGRGLWALSIWPPAPRGAGLFDQESAMG